MMKMCEIGVKMLILRGEKSSEMYKVFRTFSRLFQFQGSN